ncbi:MAG: ABC-2 transporter permease, partial [Desulfobacterales bacterium]|nr:ABC-2 transporter permease [Desulfobacterales bacterium]
MFNLIKKEFFIQKRNLLVAFLYSIFAMFVFQNFESGAFIISGVAITYILFMNASFLDEKSRTEIVINSLPIDRKDVVLAKYLSVIVFTIYAIVAYWIASFILKLLALPITIQSVSLKGIITIIFLVGLMHSLYIPLNFRFGYSKLRIITTFLFMAMLFAPNFLIIYMQKNSNTEIVRLFKARLSGHVSKGFQWSKLPDLCEGLSNAEIVRVADEAVKEALTKVEVVRL